MLAAPAAMMRLRIRVTPMIQKLVVTVRRVINPASIAATRRRRGESCVSRRLVAPRSARFMMNERIVRRMKAVTTWMMVASRVSPREAAITAAAVPAARPGINSRAAVFSLSIVVPFACVKNFGR